MSIEKEEQAIADAYSNGQITLAEYNEQLRQLYRDYREIAQEAAQEAYDNEMGRW